MLPVKGAPKTFEQFKRVQIGSKKSFHIWTPCRIMYGMADYGFTNYFENEVLRKRPYLKKEWCIRVCENPIRSEPQEHNRLRFWGEIDELGGQVLRVITLEDRKTIHNAFPDRRFKR